MKDLCDLSKALTGVYLKEFYDSKKHIFLTFRFTFIRNLLTLRIKYVHILYCAFYANRLKGIHQKLYTFNIIAYIFLYKYMDKIKSLKVF